MNQAEYKSTIESLLEKTNQTDRPTDNAGELLHTLSKAEALLFEGKDDLQPVKWHQFKRIYNLAITCIEIVRILWPYIKLIISLIKK